MEFPAQRRLHAIQSHLLPSSAAEDAAKDESFICRNLTSSSAFFLCQTYSVVLPEKLQTGKWNVYRSVRSPMKLLSRFDDHPEIGTLHDNFVHAVETYKDHKYLGTRIRVDGTVGEYKWMTFGEAATAREAIGSGLRYYGLEQGACVGLYFINRPEWQVVDHACSAYSYISVPLYDTLGPDAVKFVVNHSSIQAIFCVPETLNTLFSFISLIPSVRLIVVVGGADEHLPSLPSTSGVKLISYLKLHGQGRSNLHPFCPPNPEDVATICYTSGTTGTPKGVVLTHGNLIASVSGFCRAVKFYPSDIYISYLPLAHIYERTNQIICIYNGVGVGFYQGICFSSKIDITTNQFEEVSTEKITGVLHMSRKQGYFDREEIEKLRNILKTPEKPIVVCSLGKVSSSGKASGFHRLNVSIKSITSSWVIDSGATDHMIHSSQKFSTYTVCPSNKKIVVADGLLTTVAGLGDVHVNPSFVLKNVLHVIGLSTNLISIQKLTKDMNYKVTFYPSYCEFQDQSSEKMIGLVKENDGLNYLEISNSTSNIKNSLPLLFLSEKSSNKDKIWLYHFRLGHLSFGTLRNMFPYLFKGLNVEDFHCDVCELAKHRRVFSN